jgi:hypothetical protein
MKGTEMCRSKDGFPGKIIASNNKQFDGIFRVPATQTSQSHAQLNRQYQHRLQLLTNLNHRKSFSLDSSLKIFSNWAKENCIESEKSSNNPRANTHKEIENNFLFIVNRATMDENIVMKTFSLASNVFKLHRSYFTNMRREEKKKVFPQTHRRCAAH